MKLMICMAVVVVAVVGAPSKAKADQVTIKCDDVTNYLKPCMDYLLSGISVISQTGECCTGIKNLNEVAKSSEDQQSVCNCLKEVARKAPSYMVKRAAVLPTKCGIQLPYQISPSTNCARCVCVYI